MRKKKQSYPLSFIHLLIGVFIVITILFYARNAYFNMLTKKAPSKILQSTDKMTSSEFSSYKKEFGEILLKSSPTEALAALSDKLDSNAKVARYCHSYAHEIGHMAFNKYGFADALTYIDDLCGSGYAHGVIEEYFVKIDDLGNAVTNACTVGSNAMSLESCYHGVGHGLMFYTNNDIPKSLSYCDWYTDTIARARCSEGVFMENFNSDERFHKSKYLKSNDPLYPCQEQTQFYKDSCYFYAPDYYLILHDRDYKGAIELCKKAEAGFDSICIKGVGSRAMKYNIAKPKFVEAVCMNAKGAYNISFCIDGMMSYYLVHTNSVSKSKAVCETLEDGNKSACYNAVTVRATHFLD